VDLTLFGSDYRFSSSFTLHALRRLSIDHTTVRITPILLDPVVLPSLRSLALFDIGDNHDIAYLKRSRLADLVPQLEVLFLESRIIQRGLGYLIPALSRTLFDYYLPSSADRIDLLQVAQHLRLSLYLYLAKFLPQLSASIANKNRQISLRSIYLDISLEDLSSLPVDSVKAVQYLLSVCKERGIEVIYEEQEDGLADELRPSEEFGRRQREIRKSEATSE